MTGPFRPLSRLATNPFAGLAGTRALRHRNYRLFFGGQLVSLIGTWMQSVAQSWLVLQMTGDPFLLGVVAAAQFTPVLFLGLFGGLLADHLPKRRTLMGTQVFAMTVSFTMFLLTATHTVQIWHVLVLAAVMGVRNAIEMPTRQAFAVEMVGRDDVPNAVALNSAVFNGARVVGPAIGGLVIGAFGVPIAFLVDAVSFLAVLLGLYLMDDRELNLAPIVPRPRTIAAVRENLAEGLRYVRSTPTVLLAIVVIGLVSTFGMNFTVLVPALAKDVLHSDAAGYGFLMAASGVGSLIAALVIAFSGVARPRMIAIGALVLGLAEIVVGWSHVFGVSLVAMFFVGVGGIVMAANANTVIQLSVPDALRGRVISVYTTVFAGSTPFGGLIMGGIAGSLGVAISLVIGGVLSGVVALGGASRLWGARVVPPPDARPGGPGGIAGRAGRVEAAGLALGRRA